MSDVRLTVGQQAPDFTLDTVDGPVTLSQEIERAEQGVIVYFYPRAMTPGCTTEACDFRDSENSLKSAGYTVIGISPDSVDSIRKFVDKESLNFPLASDPDKAVMKEWGAYGKKMNYGKEVEGVIRSTVVVGKDGKVVLPLYNVKATGHVARVRRELGVDA
ncbi:MULTISPECIES: peroxiredoxin [Trueperella]|mgnify:CR=1 FL=1|uniref:thioredoxin-dependent peroxiredoxin n=1 Tax=Trueperella bernardiae TaxID=59561 RepID=A0AAW6ZKN3_9ACTO|nr:MULTISPECIES: peroxiredoxin [Trueperella]MCM3908224.1 peroxiredoxin [Trueperella bernardiae]MDK8601956.1 peroxiredoxin [Trueperella bernardiae]MDV6239562.1 peroxiredoxin [Trueperella bernardiae]OCW59756.1 peroxiredoxin [Trueperella bernardiae]OFS65669.1 peroxiredoxin [Trueperella sp. HMSC08H06]